MKREEGVGQQLRVCEVWNGIVAVEGRYSSMLGMSNLSAWCMLYGNTIADALEL